MTSLTHHPIAPDSRTADGHHVAVWLVWLVCALAVLQLAPTPPAVLLVIGVSALVVRTCAAENGMARAYPALLALAAVFAAIRVALTALTTHGGEDVLARLPAITLPALLGGFTVGGTLHRGVILRSVAEGLVVVGVIASLTAFNAAVSHHQLLRMLPRAFAEAALVVGIALTFIPGTLAAVAAVREADRARTGMPGATGRGWPRRLGAVLERAMERAVLLSESMESRGFGHTAAGRPDRNASRLGLAGLLALACACGALLGRQPAWAALAAAVGAMLLAAAVALVSRGQAPGGLPRPRPTRRDGLLIALMLAGASGVLALRLSGEALRWAVDSGAPPPMSPLLVPCALLLAAPAAATLLRSPRP